MSLNRSLNRLKTRGRRVNRAPKNDAVHEGIPGRVADAQERSGVLPRHQATRSWRVRGFDGAHDTITLTHRARSRDGFALGAVLAGEWIAGRSGWQSFDGAVDEFLARGVEGKGGAGE